MEFEMDQMKIVVGSLVCQPDPEKQNGIEDRIENIELQNNRTQDIMNHYSEKFADLENVLDDNREELFVLHEMLKNHTQIDIQVEIEEEQPSAFQGEFKKILNKRC